MGSLFVHPLTFVLSSFKEGEENGKKIRPSRWSFLTDLAKKVFYEFVGAEPIRLRARSIR